MDRYAIRGGREGYERLQLLARERWPDTSDLLAWAGVGPGLRCVDLGCGGGEVTFQIARLVGPDGQATGVDMDEVKLALAREAAQEHGVDNVEFRALDVNEWDEANAYDVVYCRFLLHHLSRPVDLLRRMWAGVRSGGVLIIEDADFDGWYCHPPNAGLDFFVRTYRAVLERRGGDAAGGRKVYAYLLEAGVPDAHVKVVQPSHTSGDTKALALSTLQATAAAITEEGVATADEIEAALADLSDFTRDPTTLIGGPRIFQYWWRR